MDDYVAPQWRDLLASNGIAGFESLWNLDVAWFEPPNRDRGGWSGVSRVALSEPGGAERAVFLKRQEDHTRYSWRHPFLAEPTFETEMRQILALQAAGVPSLVPVFYAQRRVDGHWRAILMTEALNDYQSIDEWAALWRSTGWAQHWRARRAMIRKAGAVVRKLHDRRLVHNALYPKHLFARVDAGGGTDVCLIDLEKMRHAGTRRRAMLRDLDSLNRRTAYVSRTDRLRFLLSYLGVGHVTSSVRRIWENLAPRDARKRLHGRGN